MHRAARACTALARCCRAAASLRLWLVWRPSRAGALPALRGTLLMTCCGRAGHEDAGAAPARVCRCVCSCVCACEFSEGFRRARHVQTGECRAHGDPLRSGVNPARPHREIGGNADSGSLRCGQSRPACQCHPSMPPRVGVAGRCRSGRSGRSGRPPHCLGARGATEVNLDRQCERARAIRHTPPQVWRVMRSAALLRAAGRGGAPLLQRGPRHAAPRHRRSRVKYTSLSQ